MSHESESKQLIIGIFNISKKIPEHRTELGMQKRVQVQLNKIQLKLDFMEALKENWSYSGKIWRKEPICLSIHSKNELIL